MKLTREQRKSLQEALEDAFPSPAALQHMMGLGFDEHVLAHVKGDTLCDAIDALITWAASRGRIGDLLDAARAANSTNRLLEVTATQFANVPRQSLPTAVLGAAPSAQSVAEIREALWLHHQDLEVEATTRRQVEEAERQQKEARLQGVQRFVLGAILPALPGLFLGVFVDPPWSLIGVAGLFLFQIGWALFHIRREKPRYHRPLAVIVVLGVVLLAMFFGTFASIRRGLSHSKDPFAPRTAVPTQTR